MNKTVIINPLEDERWEELVQSHPLSWITHTTAWLRTLMATFKYLRPCYIGLEDGNGVLRAGLPLVLFKSPLTGRRLVSLPYSTICDPLVSSDDELLLLIKRAISLSSELKARYLEIRTWRNGRLTSQIPELGHRSEYVLHVIDLRCPLSDIKQRISNKSCRWHIRRAQRQGVIVEHGNDLKDLGEFYRLNQMTMHRLGLPGFPDGLYQAWWDEFKERNQVMLFLVKKDKKTISALWAFVYNGAMSVESIGWDDNFKSLVPNYLGYWSAIEWAHTKGLRRFDFGRTPKSEENLLRWKDKWGASRSPMTFGYYPEDMARHAVINSRTKNIIRSFFRMAPRMVQKSLSKAIYNHRG